MKQTPDSNETLSMDAAADYIYELLGHRPNVATVFRFTRQGHLPCFRIGRRMFTTRTAVQEMLKSFNSPKPKSKRKS